MAAGQASAGKPETAGRDWQAQAVWVAATAGGAAPRIAVHPAEVAAGEIFLFTNDPGRLAGLPREDGGSAGRHVVEAAELQRLLRPEAAADNPDRMPAPTPAAAEDRERQAPERLLWQLWRELERETRALPPWALGAAGEACQALGEEAIARLFRLAGGTARRGGTAKRPWQESFPVAARRVEQPPLPGPDDCVALDLDEAARLLAPDGPVAGLLPGYEPRPGQEIMLRAVAEAFNSGRHLLAEAGTGVGKSLAYLLPAALWARRNGMPVVVSTNTRNLQTQLVEKDMPLVRQAIGGLPGSGGVRPLRAALVKGRANYLCLRRLGGLLEQGVAGLDRQELRHFARVVCWAARTSDGDLDALAGGGSVDPSFLPRLASLAEECPGRACPLHRRCFLQKAREAAQRADLVVANHALVFTELETPGISLPRHEQIVFDEAHNLEEAATRFFSVECSPARLNAILRRLAGGGGPRRGGLLERLRRLAAGGGAGGGAETRAGLRRAVRVAQAGADDVGEAGRRLFQCFHRLLAPDEAPRRYRFPPAAEAAAGTGDDAGWRAAREACAALGESIGNEIAALSQVMALLAERRDGELDLTPAEGADVAGAIQMLRDFAADAAMTMQAGDDEHVFWLQRARGREPLGEARAAPLRIGPRLAAALYERRRSVILSSATLAVGGSFAFIGERLGLDLLPPGRLQTCLAPSPFDYVRQCAVLAPVYLPAPDDAGRSYAAELATLLRLVATAIGGRTLALFTSHEMLRQCARMLATPLREAGIRLLVQGESGSRDHLARVFRRGEKCVLLGAQSFWEGVDVMGEALSCVVLARLPFASPGDPVLGARGELLDREGRGAFRALALPAAVLRFRQGFGRLIRHRRDRGVAIVADNRLLTRSYGALFRRSLPCPVLPCPDAGTLLRHVGELLPPPAAGA
jgi:Rad3-related DNA helicase